MSLLIYYPSHCLHIVVCSLSHWIRVLANSTFLSPFFAIPSLLHLSPTLLLSPPSLSLSLSLPLHSASLFPLPHSFSKSFYMSTYSAICGNNKADQHTKFYS